MRAIAREHARARRAGRANPRRSSPPISRLFIFIHRCKVDSIWYRAEFRYGIKVNERTKSREYKQNQMTD